MNKFPLWKYVAVIFALCIGLVYSAPNLYPPDAAIQISVNSSSQTLSASLKKKAVKALEGQNIEVKAAEVTDKHILIRLADKNDQLHAKELIDIALNAQYIVALNLAPTTPEWLMSLGATPMKLGLDLSGGVHFLLEVDTDFALSKRLDGYKGDIRKILREARVRGVVDSKSLSATDGKGSQSIEGAFNTEALRDEAVKLVKESAGNLIVKRTERGDKFIATWTVGEQEIKQIANDAVSQNLTALRNRVNELGVSEPLVQRQGLSRIVVELPGVQDSATAKRIIGKTASLEFRLEADGKSAQEMFNFRAGTSRRPQGALTRSVVITGENVTDAKSSFDENGRAQVSITLDSQGGKKMNAATRSNIGRALGVLFIERKFRAKTVFDENGKKALERIPYYQQEIISLATIQSALGVQFRITGLDSQQEAQDLALLLRAGALAAPIDFVEERTIGPSLGAEN
ncbi:MAG: protein translocase subunit SecD, partial [Sinobacterium sp.]|nr:protein translocase subunit SecD [Sinobacterium sp.]